MSLANPNHPATCACSMCDYVSFLSGVTRVFPKPTEPAVHILDHFKFEHLKSPLREVSQPFGELAREVASRRYNDQQRMSLEHLLIAKDAAVRAKIEEIAMYGDHTVAEGSTGRVQGSSDTTIAGPQHLRDGNTP